MNHIVKCNSCGWKQSVTTKKVALAIRRFHIRKAACDSLLEAGTNVVIYKVENNVGRPAMIGVNKLFFHEEIKVE